MASQRVYHRFARQSSLFKVAILALKCCTKDIWKSKHNWNLFGVLFQAFPKTHINDQVVESEAPSSVNKDDANAVSNRSSRAARQSSEIMRTYR